ncbi:FtsK/SpoIIIE domain-containing protein [Kineococcus sp. SYSU DK001]|uniref:FtsK/SpoIIIE domain-containing protein n=1 Tax=Kineococcus sp. SYSU DK001 TaxID=3383122 RepID=UPI003D7DD976
MRLLLTLLPPAGSTAGRGPRDVAVEVGEDASVGDLARALGAGDAPLFLGADALDPAEPLRLSRIRSGVVLGAGAAVPDVLTEPDGAVELRVVSGPGAGRVHRLRTGTVHVGSDPAADVVLGEGPPRAVRLTVTAGGAVHLETDAALAATLRPAPVRRRRLPGPLVVPAGATTATGRRARRRAARTGPADPVQTLDPDAGRPLLSLDRRPLAPSQPWPPGAQLVVGADTGPGTVLELRAADSTPDAVLERSPRGATVDVNRPPRLLPPERPSAFALPAVPTRPDKQAVGWLTVLAPLVLSLALYAATRSPYTLAFAVLSPVMAVGNVTTSRRQASRRYRRELAGHRARSAAVRADAHAALLAEQRARHAAAPDPATVLLTAVGPRARLWERRREDPDRLATRIGTADQPSEVTLTDPARAAHEGPLRWSAPDVPVVVDLAAAGVLGVAGPAARRGAVAGWVLAQQAVLTSPVDLRVVLLSTAADTRGWDWVRWLPHAHREDAGPGADVAAGVDEASLTARLSELTDLVGARHALRGPHRDAAPAGPEVLVVLDGAHRLRALPGVVTLLRDGPAVGVRLLCLDDDVRALPQECAAVVEFTATGAATVSVTGAEVVEDVRLDEVTPGWCERVARALAPLRDSSHEDLAANLPASSRLLDLLGLDLGADALPGELVRRWGAGGRTTLAPVGVGPEGAHVLDVRADGPHGLVAGTTGSGKSELLQTIIASLAVGNRPDEFTFVLVDYKGGAAFEDCRDLPHTVGLVTDLDGHLTTRALVSLGAELRRREHLLAAAGAKDVEDYTAARDRDGALEPVPRLLIVIDEFAALVAELPDFVTGLVDIARRGRSLGVHLLLATQRPAGVVSAEIRSNTALRIALRVTDVQDSQDVLDGPEAARIARTTPGRAYSRSGTSSLTAFQTARVGGRAGAGARTRVGELALVPDRREPAAEEDPSGEGPTDLARLVSGLRAAAGSLGLSARRSPWLPALPGRSVLPAGEVVRGTVPGLRFGTVDLPADQRRDDAVFSLTSGAHLGVVGASRSGRSSVLRALAGAVASTCHPADVHVYGIDCGSGALLPLTALPHTGAVVTRDQVDRVARLTDRVRAEIARRQALLADLGFASVTEQRAAADPADRLPHLLVLLDRWEGFVAAFEPLDGGRLVDAWQQVLAEGGAMGVSVVATVDRTGLVGRVSTLLDDKLVLRLTDPGDFGAIGLPSRQVPATMPAGRGFRADPTAEQPVETQVHLLVEDPSGTEQVAALQRLGRRASAGAGELPVALRPFRVDVLPTRLALSRAQEEFPAGFPATGAPDRLEVAVGGDTLGLRGFDPLEDGPGLLVAGPRRSGRSTVLRVLAEQALERGFRVGVVTARRSPLRELADRAGVLACLTTESDREAVAAATAALAPGAGLAPSVLLVDDLELLGQDGLLADAVSAHLDASRDSGCLVVGAGGLEELQAMYRGPVTALKRGRSGILLTPRSVNDGDLFGLRLSRSVLGGPPGRGFLVRAGSGESVQVLLP